jgi:hypothetical protein
VDLQTLRRYAQITLAVIAVLSAAGAAFRYLVRGGSFLGPHIVATPAEGTVGMRPFFELAGYRGDREISLYLCVGSTGGVEDCALLGKGKPGEKLRSAPIPRELPDTTEVAPGTYALRAGPEAEGDYPERGTFKVVEFDVGPRPRPLSFSGLSPSSLRIGGAREVATGAACRTPIFLGDDRITVGQTVLDPATGVTTEFNLQAKELAWSSSGDKVAILTPDSKEIRLAGPDGSGAVAKVREARGLLSSLSWSPDGDRLAYIAQNDPTTRLGPGPPTVRILNAVTGEITSAGPGLNVAWSPKPELLAVEMAGAVIQASTPQGGRRPLTTGRRPGWSPDGNYLTVVRETGGTRQGWIVPIEGASASAIGGDGVCALAFSASGKEIAVVVDREGTTKLFLRKVELPEAREG